AAVGAVILVLPLMLFGPKRWHCHKCDHIWDDPKAGPKEMTRLEPDDPRPVFRLARGHGGMGLFLGASIGGVSALVLHGDAAAVAFLVATLLGWLIGRSIRSSVCSEPTCRAPLPRGAEECA